MILEGKNAKGELGAAQNGIEAIDVDGVVLKNMWARNYQSNGFFVHADAKSGQRCDGYTMDNLLASANRSYGLFAKGCLGGKMINSAGYHHGDSAFYVGETPCDSQAWTNHGVAPPPAPCQRKPKWTLLKNDTSYENVLGYSGTNSKYVKILDSAFYNNGAGIVPNTLDSEGFEPNGWNVFERNDVFWNNYNYFLSGLELQHRLRRARPGRRGDGQLPDRGRDRALRRRRQRRPQEQRLRQLQVGHRLLLRPGRNRSSPTKATTPRTSTTRSSKTRWAAKAPTPTANSTSGTTPPAAATAGRATAPTRPSRPGNGKVAAEHDLPGLPAGRRCSTDQVAQPQHRAPGLQINLGNESRPDDDPRLRRHNPPQNQQCTWVRRVAAHPAFQNYKPVEVAPLPGELTCK